MTGSVYLEGQSDGEPAIERRRSRIVRLTVVNSRNALFLGFGGLLLLMVFSGIDAVHVLSLLRTGNGAIRQEFLERARRIDEIRSALYLSGTLVRDYLLEPDSHKAGWQGARLRSVRERMDEELQDYAHLLPPSELAPVVELRTRLEGYWQSLDRCSPGLPATVIVMATAFYGAKCFPGGRQCSTWRIASEQ